MIDFNKLTEQTQRVVPLTGSDAEVSEPSNLPEHLFCDVGRRRRLHYANSDNIRVNQPP